MLESLCPNLAYRCTIALSRRSNSSEVERAKLVVEVVGVVRVVVRLPIAAPTDVGIVAAELIWIGLHTDALARRSKNPLFCTARSSGRNEPIALPFPNEHKLPLISCVFVSNLLPLQAQVGFHSNHALSGLISTLQQLGLRLLVPAPLQHLTPLWLWKHTAIGQVRGTD